MAPTEAPAAPAVEEPKEEKVSIKSLLKGSSVLISIFLRRKISRPSL